jgi:general secretion pathway protein A
MYRYFYGFSEKPFDVTPDPRFLYLSPAYQEVLASLTYGIRERRGFIAIIGEAGTGKTTLLNAVLDRLDENTKVALIFFTNLSFDQMLVKALMEFGLAKPEEKLSELEALSRLDDFAMQQIAKGGNVVLIVDEAQVLSSRAMENFRLLSNLETRRHKLIQIVLSGQPELDTKLGQHELRQLAQRISLKRYITPLSEKETYEYIQHRLMIAGYKGTSLFSRGAKRLIWEYSGGIPRKINILCDNTFLIGYALKRKKIKEPVIREVIHDLSWSPFSGTIGTQPAPLIEQPPPQVMTRTHRSRFALIASLVLSACVLFFVAATLGLVRFNSESEQIHVSEKTIGLQIPTKKEKPQLSQEIDLNEPVSEQTQGSQKTVKLQIATVKVNPRLSQEIDLNEPVSEQTHDSQKTAKLQIPTVKEKPRLSQETPRGEKDGALTERTKLVVARRGDYLSAIIRRHYGKYTVQKLEVVLKENPEILDSDLISEGQVIKLPSL